VVFEERKKLKSIGPSSNRFCGKMDNSEVLQEKLEKLKRYNFEIQSMLESVESSSSDCSTCSCSSCLEESANSDACQLCESCSANSPIAPATRRKSICFEEHYFHHVSDLDDCCSCNSCSNKTLESHNRNPKISKARIRFSTRMPIQYTTAPKQSKTNSQTNSSSATHPRVTLSALASNHLVMHHHQLSAPLSSNYDYMPHQAPKPKKRDRKPLHVHKASYTMPRLPADTYKANPSSFMNIWKPTKKIDYSLDVYCTVNLDEQKKKSHKKRDHMTKSVENNWKHTSKLVNQDKSIYSSIERPINKMDTTVLKKKNNENRPTSTQKLWKTPSKSIATANPYKPAEPIKTNTKREPSNQSTTKTSDFERSVTKNSEKDEKPKVKPWMASSTKIATPNPNTWLPEALASSGKEIGNKMKTAKQTNPSSFKRPAVGTHSDNEDKSLVKQQTSSVEAATSNNSNDDVANRKPGKNSEQSLTNLDESIVDIKNDSIQAGNNDADGRSMVESPRLSEHNASQESKAKLDEEPEKQANEDHVTPTYHEPELNQTNQVTDVQSIHEPEQQNTEPSDLADAEENKSNLSDKEVNNLNEIDGRKEEENDEGDKGQLWNMVDDDDDD
jgi:hypothetical protein